MSFQSRPNTKLEFIMLKKFMPTSKKRLFVFCISFRGTLIFIVSHTPVRFCAGLSLAKIMPFCFSAFQLRIRPLASLYMDAKLLTVTICILVPIVKFLGIGPSKSLSLYFNRNCIVADFRERLIMLLVYLFHGSSNLCNILIGNVFIFG